MNEFGLPAPELSTELWNDHADWWQREFTDGVDPEYTEQIIPLVAEGLSGVDRVLDIGTGEGQIARHLGERGQRVVGVDPVLGQVAEAARRGAGHWRCESGDESGLESGEESGLESGEESGHQSGRPVRYAQADAAALPFADRSFDGALACLVFEHIDRVDEAIAEVARILRPGGRFVFLLNHPLLQTPGSGWIDDQLIDPPEQYWRVGPYLIEDATIEEVQKGVFIRFIHRPLSRYVNALAAASLLIERMDEPAPPPGFLAQAPQYEAAATVPRLLALHCVKTAR
ncbi:MAG: class I SAM-dependent methyltransferase [Acidimicrobiales bacterium]